MDLMWMFAGTLVYFVYQIKIFLYASKILEEPYNNIALFILFSTVNTVFLTIYYAVNAPHSLFYTVALIVLAFEFMIISKANMLQAFTGASVFLLNIALVHVPTTIIYSKIKGFFPLYAIQNTTHRSKVLLISCVILILLVLLVERVLSAVDIKRITTAGKYTAMLFFTTYTALLFVSAHSYFVITTDNYPEQLYYTVLISAFIASIFYYIFIYNILLINASLYKRYSDTAKEEQEKILETKRKISDKIERDSLTGIYSRRYIITTLEELLKDEESVFSILFVDVNGLKQTNDTYGHEAGDRLIVKVGLAISHSIRDDDFAARIGGDEFLIVLSNTTDEITQVVTDRINENIAIQNETEDFLISASIGSLLVDNETKKGGVNLLLAKADDLMRQNKEKFYTKVSK